MKMEEKQGGKGGIPRIRKEGGKNRKKTQGSRQVEMGYNDLASTSPH